VLSGPAQRAGRIGEPGASWPSVHRRAGRRAPSPTRAPSRVARTFEVREAHRFASGRS
jgi:hypothetical protein